MPRSPRVVSECKRERDVFHLYGPAFRDIRYLEQLQSPETCTLPADYVPTPAMDASIMAFTQLAAIRLGASRAMVSLIDGQRQHILAEATPSASPRHDSPLNASSSLWLGNVSIPRTWGVCEKLLAVDPKTLSSTGDGAVIINDLAQTEQYANRVYVKSGPQARFYVGVALTSPFGAIVGALCVFGDEPRHGLPRDDIVYLQDLASTIMVYLETYTLRDQHRRGEQLTRGLISFAEGASSLRSFADDQISDSAETPLSEKQDQDTILDPTTADSSAASECEDHEEGRSENSTQDESIFRLQEKILPVDSKEMFARAARIIRESSNLDGVLFLDASAATVKPESFPKAHSGWLRTGPGHPKRGKKCQLLGSAVKSPTRLGALEESHLSYMLHRFPNGKILNFTRDGIDENDGMASPLEVNTEEDHDVLNSLQFKLPGVQSLAFLPFWDYERSRWFAGCLCWSTKADRILSAQHDLLFFKVFSHSIMRELSRLDTIATSRAKTSFLSSVSHELRTPIHGIMGSIHHLENTALDSFQTSMLNSLSTCGRLLLHTIEQVLDYVNTGETKRNMSFKQLGGINKILVSSEKAEDSSNICPEDACCELAMATEDVVETTFAGELQSVFSNNQDENSNMSSSTLVQKLTDSPSLGQYSSKRKHRFIILDIEKNPDWNFTISLGSWSRIISNLFRNALKFTLSGHIQISLRCSSMELSKILVELSITDTGVGMKPDFLANKSFQAFSKEDSHSTGTGVGLSIVRQIIENIGGVVEVQSEAETEKSGTNICVKLALPQANSDSANTPQISELPAIVPRIQGKRVCIVQKIVSSETTATTRHLESLRQFTETLVSTLREWLLMDVIRTNSWEEHIADIFICPEVSFECLTSIRSRSSSEQRLLPTVFIAMDSLEAATMRSDARIAGDKSIIEVITQPCGPLKLAKAIDSCLERQDVLRTGQASLNNLPPQSLSILAPEEQPPSATLPSSVQPPPRTNTIPLRQLTPTQKPSTKPNPALSQAPIIQPNSHILIVDDNAINSKILSAFLKKHSFLFTTATNGLQALETYKVQSLYTPKSSEPHPEPHHTHHHYPFTTILMDISMPIMDGMTCTREIRAFEQECGIKACQILALTGLTSASARLEALTSGVDGYLTKPVDFKKLLRLLEEGRSGGLDGGGSGSGGENVDGNGARERKGEGVEVGIDGQ